MPIKQNKYKMNQYKTSLKDSKVSYGADSTLQDVKMKNSGSSGDQKSLGKATSLDLKKVNLNKDPRQSNSSLELLILLLHKTLHMSLEQILGLFTNNNKYLAHIIVKGINEDFSGIREFYTKMNQFIQTLIRLYHEDNQDAFACLYAIKPGFISKDIQVAELTISLFSQFEGIYQWFVRDDSKCSSTLLLGFKRHQSLVEKYSAVLFTLIKGHQIDYFSNHYTNSLSSSLEIITITTRLAKYLSKIQIVQNNQEEQTFLFQEMQRHGIFQKWFEIAWSMYDNDLDDKITVLDFIGQFMLWLPQVIQKNQIILNSVRQNWSSYQLVYFVPLFSEIIIILQKLANAKSPVSKKLYNIIIDIFNDTYQQEDKRQYIVNSFFCLLAEFPNIPSDLFIKHYHMGKVSASDFMLICEAIDVASQENSLIRIGNIVKELFFFDVIHNFYLGQLIPELVKKVVRFVVKQTLDFINELFRTILYHYLAYVIKVKNQPVSGTGDTYFGKKKRVEKSVQNEKNETVIMTKRADLTMDLLQKVIDTILQSNVPESYLQTIKSYCLGTSAQIKKNNFGMASKRLISVLQKKLKLTKQQQQWFQEQNKQNLNKSVFRLSESALSKKGRQTYGAISSLSRVQVPQRLTKEFDQIVSRRKRQEVQKVQQQAKRKKQEQLKKVMYKKQLQKMNLIKGGFGQGEAQLKEEGFWNKFIKESNEQIKVYIHEEIEDVYLDAADLIIKKYNKLFKYFFFNYSGTMYSVKATNFDQNAIRKQTLSAVEAIKFLKDYDLIFPTNLQQIQNLIRQINVRILRRKQVINELDFEGFEQFIRQFCLCIWNRNQKVHAPAQVRHLKLDHFSLPELVQYLIIHLKNVFKVKGENMSFFEIAQPQVANPSEEIQQLNEKLTQNPNFILPEGFKKVIDKKIQFKPLIKDGFNFLESYKYCLEVLDQIIQEKFKFHIIQPHSQKIVKATAKPFHQISVRDRDPTKIKSRALSTIIDRKKILHSSLSTALTKNDLSKGIKKGMLLLRNQDKIIGQQVGFVLEEILMKICDDNPVNPTRTVKINSNIVGNIRKRDLSHRRIQSVSKIQEMKLVKPLSQGKNFEKLKQATIEKRQAKIQEEKKREEQIKLKLKRKKEQQEKYYQQLKQRIQQKKKEEAMEEKKKEAQKEVKEQKKVAKQKFEQFNSKQVDKLKKQFSEIVEKKKKIQEQKQGKNQQNEQKMRKIRAKIENDNKEISQIRKQTLEAIIELSFSQGFKNLAQEYDQPLRTVFSYLQKHHSNPLADKKCKTGQIDYDTWLKFNKLFQISPLIVSSKDTINIFKAVTKDKRVTKQYLVGLTYDEFLQCLLRQCIKQKTIFTKLTERIKQQQPATKPKQTKGSKQKSTPAKIQPKNQFEEDEELDPKKLLKEADVRDDIIDHYGDISKFNIESFKGLIYYLRMPFSKKGQQKRIKQLIQNEKKVQNHATNIQKLKEKLKAEYTLERDKKQSKVQPIQKTQAKVSKKEPQPKEKNDNKLKVDKKQVADDTKSKKSIKK